MSQEPTDTPLPVPRVVLVRPKFGENVGGSARAMANTGLRDLRIVGSPRIEMRRAEHLAHGALKLLARAQRCESMEDALGDCQLVVACTARPRRWKAWEILGPSESAELMARTAANGEQCAMLFGPEDHGLSSTDLTWATHICHIPTGQEHSSLNLSQAVLLLGWEWAKAGGHLARRSYPRSRKRRRVSMEQIAGTSEQLGVLLDRIGFFSGRNREQALTTFKQGLLRGEMTNTELHFLRGVLRKLQWYVDHGARLEDD